MGASRRPSAGPPGRSAWLADGVGASLVGLAGLLVGSRPLVTQDVALWVALGDRMRATGSLADVDVFTCTLQGHPFVHGAWGFSLLASWIHSLGGWDALRLVTGGAVALTCLLVYLGVRSWSPVGACLATLQALLFLLQNSAPRGQTICFPLFVAFLVLSQRSWAGRGGPWVGALFSGILGFTWASLHGSFGVGVAAALLVALGEARDQGRFPAGPLACGAGLAAGALLGPYGPGLVSFVVSNSLRPMARGLAEWSPPHPLRLEGALFFLALAGWSWGALRAMARRRSPLATGDLLLAGSFALLGLSSTRHVAWFGLATAFPLARALAEPGPRARPAALAVALAAWSGVLALALPRHVPLAPDTPVALVDALIKRESPSNVFLPMEWAGYLASRTAAGSQEPPWRYPVDIRVWMFPDPVWNDWLATARAESGWQERLDRDGIQVLMLSPDQVGRDLLEAALASPTWEVRYQDPLGVILGRIRSPQAPVANPPDPW